MQEFITAMIEQYGYLAIFLLIFLENVFPPIPSEIILTFGGFFANQGNLNIVLVILVSTLGSVFGAIVLYYIGYLIKIDKIALICNGKVGKILFLNSDDIYKANNWFIKQSNKAVLICRFIPIVRSLISIPAGSSKMNIYVFILLTSLGSIVWNTVLVMMGFYAGKAWDKVAKYFDNFSLIVFFCFCLVCLYYVSKFIKSKL